MSSDVAIEFKNVSKCYSSSDAMFRVKAFLDRIKNMQFRNNLLVKEDFYALKNVSFTIKKGERVGLIGRNGAGKSTTLKLVNRISYPTAGEIVVHGKTGGVLELGAGFNTELSGRDNVYINGTLHGHKEHEIDKMLEQIIQISELERFIDTPLKKYSSGMKVRLAFAVSMTATPDIVLLDEALSVGDATFKKKSTALMEEFLRDRTLLFVSHGEEQVKRICNRVLFVQHGELLFDGPTTEGFEFYKDAVGALAAQGRRSFVTKDLLRGQAELPTVDVQSVSFLDALPGKEATFSIGYRPQVRCRFQIHKVLGDLNVRVRIKKPSLGQLSQLLAEAQVLVPRESLKEELEVAFDFGTEALSDGRYLMEVVPEFPDQGQRTAVPWYEITFRLEKPSEPAPVREGDSWRFDENGVVTLDFKVASQKRNLGHE